MVSSNYNDEIARIVAQTLICVGMDGLVNIVESPVNKNRFHLVNGLVFERGFVSEAFITENKIQSK
jgi:chaperonin GroEL (HSP60 family)